MTNVHPTIRAALAGFVKPAEKGNMSDERLTKDDITEFVKPYVTESTEKAFHAMGHILADVFADGVRAGLQLALNKLGERAEPKESQ